MGSPTNLNWWVDPRFLVAINSIGVPFQQIHIILKLHFRWSMMALQALAALVVSWRKNRETSVVFGSKRRCERYDLSVQKKT